MSKDDIDEEEHKSSQMRCSSCKELGHVEHNCPKDPNPTNFTAPENELMRIREVSNSKRKSLSASSYDLENLLKVMPFEEIKEDSEYNRQSDPVFNDLHLIRGELTFEIQNNRVQFEEISGTDYDRSFSRHSPLLHSALKSRLDTLNFDRLQTIQRTRRHSTVPEMPLTPLSPSKISFEKHI